MFDSQRMSRDFAIVVGGFAVAWFALQFLRVL
jgi:hypothetical protein